MASNYEKGLYQEFEKLNEKLDKMISENRKQSLEIYDLKQNNKKLIKELEKAHKQIQDLLLEIERLKNNNNKNSSNSSKPSSTNGFKKVITNNRNKSNNKKGAQPKHQGKTLTNEQIEKMIKDGEVDEVIVVEENKNEHNKKFKPIIRYEYDIKIKIIVTKHVIYPNKKINIENYPAIYGNNIKVIECLLNQRYMSLDGIQDFFYDTTNNQLLTSKGSFYSWNKDIYNKLLLTEYEYIKEQLMNSLVLNVDESPIKINGEQYYLHNISDGLHTLQYVTKHRSQDDIDDFGFLKTYKGILVHDHYAMYYNYGSDNAECNVHVLRYLNGVSEFTKHKWAQELKELLLEMKMIKEQYIDRKQESISDVEFNTFRERYLNVLYKGKEEMKTDYKTNSYKDDERKLINRLIKYCDNHLYF